MDMIFHVINLAHRGDRWQSFVDHAGDKGIPYVRFDAIVPSKADMEGWKHSKGLRGCNLSHKTLWKQFLESDEELLGVLEDDARMVKHWRGDLPDDFDILYLGCNPTTYKKFNRAKYKHYHIARRVLTTHAYIMSRKGAEKALQTPIETEAVDVALWEVQKKNKCFYYSPSLFIQNPDFSDILNKKVNYTELI
jgi:GR25 family glycosyltransferase involved in LPS biosynthesis